MQRSVAMVMSAGGIKPIAVIPLLQMLQDEGIHIDFFAGSSGGAMVAALAALGRPAAELPEICAAVLHPKLFKPLRWRKALGLLGMPGGRPLGHTEGLIDPSRIKAAIDAVYGDTRIEDTATLLAISATDHMTGDPLTLTQGVLADAVYGSIALWPMLPPSRFEGRWLSDGGYSVAVPIIEAWRRNFDVIIAIENREALPRLQNNFIKRYGTFQTAMRRQIGRSLALLGTVMHHGELIVVDLQFPTPIDFDEIARLPLILEVGRKHAQMYRSQILAAVRG
jgi:predicted acylesterase/phospholipase RssA